MSGHVFLLAPWGILAWRAFLLMKGLLRDPHKNCLTVSATRESDTHPPILYMILHCSEEYFWQTRGI